MARNSRSTLNLVMATDLSQKLRSALEFGVVIALLMGLTVLAISRFETYVIHAQIAEALGLTSTVKAEMVVTRAASGQWPSANASLDNVAPGEEANIGNFIQHLALGNDGALTAVFNDESPAKRLRGRQLTIRPLILSIDPGAPVSWVCAAHRYPTGLTPGGIDRTTIDRSDLPSACRDF